MEGVLPRYRSARRLGVRGQEQRDPRGNAGKAGAAGRGGVLRGRVGVVRRADRAGDAGQDEGGDPRGRAQQLPPAPLVRQVQAEDVHGVPLLTDG